MYERVCEHTENFHHLGTKRLVPHGIMGTELRPFLSCTTLLYYSMVSEGFQGLSHEGPHDAQRRHRIPVEFLHGVCKRWMACQRRRKPTLAVRETGGSRHNGGPLKDPS